MPQLLEVVPLPDFKLRLCYSDGVTGDVNLSHLVGKGVFQVWNDPAAFKRVSIGSCGEVQWDAGVDLCGDALYLELTGKTPAEVFPGLKRALANA